MPARIVIHTDFTAASVTAVRYARALAETLGGTLHFLHVLQEPLSAGWTAEVSASALPEVQSAMELEAGQWLESVLSETDRERFQTSLDIETGDIAEEILRYSKENQAAIIVLSASRDGSDETADTGVAETVLAKSDCSVFVVRL